MTLTDFESHHIEGYARAALERGQDGAFSVPLISHIKGNLWMGGCKDGVRLPDEFVYVFSLYPWEKYQLPEGCKRREVTMYDAGSMPDIEQLHEIANEVNACVARGRTLVHCQAGLNRSGLVTALSLVLNGMEPNEAISLLRDKRCPVVLCNETFERWIQSYVLEDAA